MPVRRCKYSVLLLLLLLLIGTSPSATGLCLVTVYISQRKKKEKKRKKRMTASVLKHIQTHPGFQRTLFIRTKTSKTTLKQPFKRRETFFQALDRKTCLLYPSIFFLFFFFFFTLAFVLVNVLSLVSRCSCFGNAYDFVFVFVAVCFFFVVCTCILCLLSCHTRCSFIDVLSCTPTGVSEINYLTKLSQNLTNKWISFLFHFSSFFTV